MYERNHRYLAFWAEDCKWRWSAGRIVLTRVLTIKNWKSSHNIGNITGKGAMQRYSIKLLVFRQMYRPKRDNYISCNRKFTNVQRAECYSCRFIPAAYGKLSLFLTHEFLNFAQEGRGMPFMVFEYLWYWNWHFISHAQPGFSMGERALWWVRMIMPSWGTLSEQDGKASLIEK